jgi:hypothetical protein
MSVIGIALHPDRRLVALNTRFTNSGHVAKNGEPAVRGRLSSEDHRATILSILGQFRPPCYFVDFRAEEAKMMSTTEKAIDLDSIRQRLDRLGVRL